MQGNHMPSSREPLTHIVAQGSKRDPQLRLHTPDPDTEDTSPEPLDPRQYQAFRTARRPPRLRIRCHAGPGHSLPYTALLDIITDDRFAASFALVFHHQVVHVSGRNLGAVVDAISDHRAAVIRVFDGQVFDIPTEGDAVIEGVEFEGGVAMKEMSTHAG
jgi:hypothetical protein